jgi:multidrug transporter EmrE-like cation transporter
MKRLYELNFPLKRIVINKGYNFLHIFIFHEMWCTLKKHISVCILYCATRYNMMGHIKFCLTVLGGVLLFEDPFHVNQGVGIVLTVLGVTAYAHVKVQYPLV